MVPLRLLVLAAACLTGARAAELWRRPAPAGSPQASESGSPVSSESAQQVSQALSRTSAALAEQFLRSSRTRAGVHQQPYDVPLIGE